MNAVGFQRSYNYDLQKDVTYSNSPSVGAEYGAFMAQDKNVLEKDSAKKEKNSPLVDFSAKEIDKKQLFEQREIETAMYTRRMSRESKNEKTQETALTKNQEAVSNILNAMGVELKDSINWNSDGSGKLTDEQIKDLKERYDVENLSQEEYYNLLTELVNLNVISGDDFEKEFVKKVPPEVAECGGMLMAASPDDSEDEYKNYLEKFLKDRELIDYYLRALESRRSSVQESNIEKMRKYYEEQKEHSMRLSDVFEQLKR